MSENSAEETDKYILDVQSLFVEHQQAVFAYVLTLEPKLHDAQKIVQEMFLTVSRKASSWESGTNFLACFFAIARFNTLHFQRTKSRRNGRLANGVVEMLTGDIDEDFSTFRSRVAALRQCLSQPAPRARAIVESRYHGNRPLQQIAANIGWTVNAVRVAALSRSRGVLFHCVTQQQAQEREVGRS